MSSYQATFDTLGNVVALDHYAAAPANYSEYVRYFADTFQTEVIFSEVGAPIPDLHGRMSEQQQADFIEEVFLELYHSRPWVRGVNYWVLSQGTTALLNSDSSPREVVEVVKDYYQSAWLYGRVSNTLGLGLSEIEVQVAGMNTTQTDAFGRFGIAVPAGEYELTFSGAEYTSEQVTVTASRAADLEYSVVLEPSQKSWWYQLKERLQELKMSAQDME